LTEQHFDFGPKKFFFAHRLGTIPKTNLKAQRQVVARGNCGFVYRDILAART
jgi:hypothetical protein